ncbi:616_t:CDS:2, partial [Acaulospora colombiana]
IVWNSPANPSHTLSCGHDGRLQIIDDRDPMFKNMFQRIRAFMMSVCWPCHYGGIAYADSDNTVRYIRMEDLKKTTGLIMHHANVWNSSLVLSPVHGKLFGGRIGENSKHLSVEGQTSSIENFTRTPAPETTITYHVPESFSHFYRPEISIQR